MMISKTWMYFVGMLAAIVTCTSTDANSIRLHDSVVVDSPTVELEEIAEIEGEYAQKFAKLTIGSFTKSSELTIKMEDIRQILTKEKANWGLLSLAGFKKTIVQSKLPLPEVIVDKSIEPIISNTIVPVDMEKRISLLSMVEDHFASRLRTSFKDLRIEFKSNDLEKLSVSTVGKQYEISPQGRSLLGRVSIVVNQYENARIVESFRIYANVTKRVVGLVSQTSLRAGDVIPVDAVELMDVWVNKQDVQPIASILHITGQILRRPIRKGALLYARDVKLPALIKKNQLVEVRAVSGALVVTTGAKAMQDGCLDEVITVRHLGSKETYSIVVTGKGRGTTAIPQLQSPVNQEPNQTFAHRGIK
ncbi:flagellar basal body P-ring formation protein FlgA [Planctomycetota bacterium]|nr:flagellar basal body P-ring formation protein FlgA [Planctomycetota bacterium]